MPLSNYHFVLLAKDSSRVYDAGVFLTNAPMNDEMKERATSELTTIVKDRGIDPDSVDALFSFEPVGDKLVPWIDDPLWGDYIMKALPAEKIIELSFENVAARSFIDALQAFPFKQRVRIFTAFLNEARGDKFAQGMRIVKMLLRGADAPSVNEAMKLLNIQFPQRDEFENLSD